MRVVRRIEAIMNDQTETTQTVEQYRVAEAMLHRWCDDQTIVESDVRFTEWLNNKAHLIEQKLTQLAVEQQAKKGNDILHSKDGNAVETLVRVIKKLNNEQKAQLKAKFMQ